MFHIICFNFNSEFYASVGIKNFFITFSVKIKRHRKNVKSSFCTCQFFISLHNIRP
jgi:hypothetical protein